MAVRSVLEVDVDDASFKAFMQTFEKYRAAVDRMPSQWAAVGQSQVAGKASLSEMAALMAAQTEMLRRTLRDSEALQRTTESAGRAWSGMAHSTKEVAGNLISATASLLRWTGITTLATGGLIGGGLFGLDRLAITASGLRRSSMGLGVSPGELLGAGAYNAALGDTRGMLSNLMQSLESAQGKTALVGAGMNPSDWQGKNASQILYPFLRNVQNIAKTTDPALSADVLQSRGLQGIVPLEVFNRLRAMSSSELGDWAKMAATMREQAKVSDQVLLGWQKMEVTLTQASQKIQLVLIDTLGGAAGPLAKLSTAFSDTVVAFLRGPAAGHMIEGMTTALTHFGEYVGKPQFAEDVSNFVSGVGNMAKAISTFVSWFASSDAGKKMGFVAGAAAGAAAGGVVGGPVGAAVGGVVGAAAGTAAGASQEERDRVRETVGAAAPYAGMFGGLLKWFGLAPGSGVVASAAIPGRGSSFSVKPGVSGGTDYDAISRAEGTYGPGGINYNKLFGGGEDPSLTGRTIAEVLQMQGTMTGSTAIGGFQINRATLQDAARGAGLDPATTKFTPETQRRLADWIRSKRGYAPWEGFKSHPDLVPGSAGGSRGYPFPVLSGSSAEHNAPSLPSSDIPYWNSPAGRTELERGPGYPTGGPSPMPASWARRPPRQDINVQAPHGLRVTIEHDGASPATSVNQVAR